MSDADVASIPSVQAVVEQTAAETRAEDLHARGQNATSDGQIIDTPQAEIAAGQETKGPENELSGAAKADNPLDGDASGSTTGHAAAALGIAAATQPSSDSSKTLEALVSEALEPKLQQWLDANLPRLVDEKVQAEIERLARDGKLSTSHYPCM